MTEIDELRKQNAGLQAALARAKKEKDSELDGDVRIIQKRVQEMLLAEEHDIQLGKNGANHRAAALKKVIDLLSQDRKAIRKRSVQE